MTRFARAKGSKASNEKTPEEATSWMEMKKAMMSKSTKKVEESDEDQNNHKKVINKPKKAEWASLENEFSNSISLIKEHLGKNKKDGGKANVAEKRKLECDLNGADGNKKNNNENKVKKKKKKIETLNSEDVGKINNKQQEINDGELESKPKKKINGKTAIETNKTAKKQQKKTENGTNVGEENNKQQKTSKLNKKKKIKNKKIANKDAKQTQEVENRKNNKIEKPDGVKNKKSNEKQEEIIVNGKKVIICKFEGSFVTQEDAERLRKLRDDFKKNNVSHFKIINVMKLEKRRAERTLKKLRSLVCFNCRANGHLVANCPQLVEKGKTDFCYKCGSTEHFSKNCKISVANYKFAECFVCKEQGHISAQCPDNPKGLYPFGGGCRNCGDVTHFVRDCPQTLAQKSEETFGVGLRNDRKLECLDEEIDKKENQNEKKKKKKPIVKF